MSSFCPRSPASTYTNTSTQRSPMVASPPPPTDTAAAPGWPGYGAVPAASVDCWPLGADGHSSRALSSYVPRTDAPCTIVQYVWLLSVRCVHGAVELTGSMRSDAWRQQSVHGYSAGAFCRQHTSYAGARLHRIADYPSVHNRNWPDRYPFGVSSLQAPVLPRRYRGPTVGFDPAPVGERPAINSTWLMSERV